MTFLEKISVGGVTLWTILMIICAFALGIIIRRIVSRLAGDIIERSHLDKGVKTFIGSAVDILTWVLLILIFADGLGIPITSLVAIVSVASLAFSLSVQNILTNIFSGVTILGTKPFTVGDFIDIGGTSGTVVSQGLFYTTLKTVDNKVIYLPNSKVADAQVTNFSVNENRRIDITICASYGDEPERVKTALMKAVERTEGVLSEPAPTVGMTNYGSSSIEYGLYVWSSAATFLNTKFELMDNIYAVFGEEGVSMTYDHINVHIEQ